MNEIDILKNNIEKFKPFNEQEEVEKRIMLKYINDFDDVLTRQNEYGHFTSSAFVLNKERITFDTLPIGVYILLMGRNVSNGKIIIIYINSLVD